MLFVLERGNRGQRPERYRKGVRELEKDGMKKRENVKEMEEERKDRETNQQIQREEKRVRERKGDE